MIVQQGLTLPIQQFGTPTLPIGAVRESSFFGNVCAMLTVGGVFRSTPDFAVDMLTSADFSSDDQLPNSHTGSVSAVRLFAFDGANFDRLRCAPDNSDSQAPATIGALITLSRLQGFTGSNFDRVRTASSGNVAALTGRGATLTAAPGNWSIYHDPADNVRATVTRSAGGSGVRLVCTSICASLSGTAASALVKVYLRNGASGVGPILWAANMIVPANGHAVIALSGLSIVGSANTAMTLEFDAAGGVGTQETVALTGYNAT